MKKGKLNNIIRWSSSFLIVLIVIIYFYYSDFDLAVTWKNIEHADFFWVGLSIPVILLSHWIRAIRWNTMLAPAIERSSVWLLFKAVMIGYAVNCVIPRGGEFVRPLVFAKKQKVSYSTTFATIVIERFIDVLTLFLLFGLAFIIFQDKLVSVLPPEVDSKSMIVLGALFFLVIIVSFYPPVFELLLRILVMPISRSIHEKLQGAFMRFKTGFAIIKTPSQYLRLSVETGLIWFFYILPMYLMFNSFPFMENLHLGFLDSFLLLIVVGFVVSVAPTPGQVGVYHIVVPAVLATLYGLEKNQALAYATLTHGINFLVQILVGGIFILQENAKGIGLGKTDLSKESVG